MNLHKVNKPVLLTDFHGIHDLEIFVMSAVINV